MTVRYDQELDALYFELSEKQPDGVVELVEGINIDTTKDGKLTGIEILNASDKFNINTILTYTLKLDHGLLKHKEAI